MSYKRADVLAGVPVDGGRPSKVLAGVPVNRCSTTAWVALVETQLS